MPRGPHLLKPGAVLVFFLDSLFKGRQHLSDCDLALIQHRVVKAPDCLLSSF